MFDKEFSVIAEVRPRELWQLAEVKNYLRVSSNHDDELITEIITAAISAAENFTSLTLTPKRVIYTCNINQKQRFILQYKPVLELTKITLRKVAQVTDVAPADFYLDPKRWTLHLANPLSDQELVVDYIAGFAPNAVPTAIKHGILLHIAEMYDRQQVEGAAFSLEVKNLYLPSRILRL